MPNGTRLLIAAVLGWGCTPPASSFVAVPEVDPPAAAAAPATRDRASVTATLEGRRNAMGKSFSWRVESTYTVFETEVDGSWRHVVQDFSGWRGTIPDQLADSPGFLAPLLTPIVLAPDGSFERLVDPPAVRAEILGLIESSGYGSQTHAAVLTRVLSDASLGVIADDVWTSHRMLVRETGLAAGEVRELPTQAPVPQLGGTLLDIAVVLRREDDRPCPGHSSRVCARYTMRAAPDQDRVRELLEALPVGRGMPKIAEFDMLTTTNLICDAETEAPHRFDVQRRSALSFVLGSGFEEQSSRTYVYEYVDPP